MWSRHRTEINSTQMVFKTLRKGCYPYLRCSNCENLNKGHCFVHQTTGKVYEIKHYLTCDSDYIIYIIQCPCGLLYVGETTMKCKARINKHKSTIRTQRRELPIPKNFLDMGHNIKELKFSIKDHVPRRRGRDRKLALKCKEFKWIFKLDTLSPKGLHFEFKVLLSMT